MKEISEKPIKDNPVKDKLIKNNLKVNFFGKRKAKLKLLAITAALIVIMSLLLLNNLIQIKKNQLQNSLAQEFITVENILSEKFNSSFLIIEKMGKEIAQRPRDKKYIKKILEKYKSDTSLNHIFFWTVFSWSDPNFQIIVDEEYGIMKNPLDLSNRDYIAKSIPKPGKFFLGKPVYGSTSKKWMIPGGVSITDSGHKILGTVTMGFEIDKLARMLHQALKNQNVTVELIYDDKIPVFDVSKSFIKIFSPQEAQSHKALLNNYNKQQISDGLILKRKLENYEYHLLLTYDQKAVSVILWQIIYSRLLEIVAAILLSVALIVIICKNENEKRKKINALMRREVLTNKSKSEFMLRVGHELKNFVAAIIGLSDIVKDKLSAAKSPDNKSFDDQNYKEEMGHLEHINDISQELISFVTDLIDLNQPEDGSFEVIKSSLKTDFEDMVDRSLRILKSKIKIKNLTVNSSFDKNLHQIANLDQRRIKQILVGIIGNAINHSAQGAKIDIFVKNLDQKRIEITVKDYAMGISGPQLKMALASYNFKEYQNLNGADSIELKLPVIRFLIEKQNGLLQIISNKNISNKGPEKYAEKYAGKDHGTEVKIIF
jgi:signal transduction histidine kinase